MEFPEFGGGEGADNTKNYIKFKDGSSVKGIFRGAPQVMRKHWIDKKPTLCDGPNCDLCASGDKPRFSFRLNMVVKEGSEYVAKIFEQGWTVYNQMRDLNVEFPLEKTIVSVTRRGSGISDTSYTILPVNGGVVTAALEAEISKIELFDLDPKQETKDQVRQETSEAVSNLIAASNAVGKSATFDDLPF